MNNETRIKLAISGSVETRVCCKDITDLAYSVGKIAAQHNCILITGATEGVPFWAAKGAKENGGIVLGLSPALNAKQHLKEYGLPIDYHDTILWTGLGYTGRNMMLSRMAEGVIIICGRIGTVNEFTGAFEDGKPIGVLEGSGGNADELKTVVEKSQRKHDSLIWDKDPEKLVSSLLQIIKKQNTFDHSMDFTKL